MHEGNTERLTVGDAGPDPALPQRRALRSSRRGASVLAALLTAVLATLLLAPAASAGTGPPVASVLPVIAGTAKDGRGLNVTAGKWTGSPPISFAYKWLRCDTAGEGCTVIAGAEKPKYAVKHEDVGHTLRVTVTATNTEGSGQATSLPTKVVVPAAPARGTKPAVTGTAQDGQIVTAAPGTWRGTPPFSYGYQWESCVKLTCSLIAGATEKTYRAATADIGKQLRVIVKASNEAGSASNTSASSPVVIAGPPVSVKAPTVSGTPIDGQTLTADTGTWAGTAPITYSYQWSSCSLVTGECTAIPGASESSYKVGPLDVANKLEVTVKAQNAHGSASATSEPTSLVEALLPSNGGGLPSIVGSLTDGQLLSALTGGWTGTGPLAFAYRWQACNAAGEACKDIEGATAATLSLVSSLVGDTVRVVVTATNQAGSVSATSPATSVIGALLPGNTHLPSIAGNLLDGSLLSALTGSWTGTSPISYAYEWQKCNSAGEACEAIAGATAATYAIVSSLVGDTVRVVVTATNAGGSVTATSPATSVIGALLPSNSALPSVVGSLIDGQTLSALSGSWSGTGPISYAYEWERCNAKGEACETIEGATGSTLALVSSLVGDTVRAVVTATNGAGSVKASSPATSVIGALLPSNSALPAIAGELLDGSLLSAVNGSWTGTGPISYGYQWQQCDAKGEACKDIEGATGATLGLVSSLVGDTVRVVVTATNAGGSAKAASAPTNLIGALLPKNTGLPSIAGSLIDGQTLSALSGSWSGTGPIGYAYEWQKCNAKGEACEKIEGATASTLALVSGLVGDTVRVVVTATNGAGSVKAASAPTSAIGALLPSSTGLPSIGGLLEDTGLLSASSGEWSGTGPLTYAYQWELCDAEGEACEEVEGSIGSTLLLAASDVGRTVRVVVTASNSAGSTSVESNATSVIAALLPGNGTLPSITGSLIDGQTLSALTGEWTGTAPIGYGYEWQKCNAKGEACEKIEGATASTLALVSGLVGDTVRVVVTATNGAGSVKAASAPTSAIAALLPGNTSLPSIGGILEDGKTLTAAIGGWTGTSPISYGYEWQKCNGKGEACEKIEGATGTTLGLVSGLVGDTVRVVVTATNSGGSVKAASAATSPVLAILPSVGSLPSIAGSLIDGQTLTAATGGWSGTAPISYGYEWQKCNGKGEACEKIEGANASTLALVSSLVGDTVRVVVTASNARGSAQAASPASGVIAALLPGNTSLPSIGGILEDGKTLTAATGAWTGSTPISYGYEWQKCNGKGEACEKIEGATASTLALVSGLVGDTVRVVVTATNSGGSVKAASAATSPVLAILPSVGSLPSIAGSLIDGQTLTAGNGTWSGTAPISYGYEWQKCDAKGEACEKIEGATGTTLGLVSSLVGDTVRVVVTASNARGSAQAASPASSVIAALLPGNTSLPSVAGSLIDGQTLTAGNGSWTGTSPISYGYEWQKCNGKGEACEKIEGATASTLALVSGLVGDTVRVVVTATNSGGSVKAASAPTGVIAALLPGNTSLPSIGGILEDGKTLTAATGSWTGTSPISYSYRWEQCNAKGEACEKIEGATASTLALVSGLIGDTIKVVVTATNSGGSVKAASAATSPVLAILPANTTLPGITGGLIDGQTLTAGNGSWTGSAPLSYSYKWEQCNAKGEACKAIEGATASTLALVSSLVGNTVRVVVTATNSRGSTPATSATTGLIAALLPKVTALPTIGSSTEKLEQGSSLKAATTGSWEGTTPITYTYSWQQCNAKGEECKSAGGEGPLSVLETLVGSTVRLLVKATNSGGSTEAASAPTSAVLAALPVNIVQPAIGGILEVGKKLLAKPETWGGTQKGTTFTYQWQLCGALGLVGECKDIAGATSKEFLLELLDVGLTLRVGVTAHNERGASPVAYSNVTGLIQGLKLSPTKGAAGTMVSVKASGVNAATMVNFGSEERFPEVKSSSEVVAEAPAGSGTVPVTVSTPEGTTHETPSTQFTYE